MDSVINQDERCIVKILSKITQMKTVLISKRNLLRFNNMCIRMEMRIIKIYIWRAMPYCYEAYLLNEMEPLRSQTVSKPS